MSVRTKKAPAPQQLKRREFFSLLLNLTKGLLPPELQDFQSRSTMNLLKIHYGANYRVHYEAWIVREIDQVELGLHFEDGPASTERLLDYFDRYILEIKHELGDLIELEQWTKSWGHLFELHELEPLTPEFVDLLSHRLARIIQTLQPILDEAYELELVPREPRPSRFGRYRRQRRRRS